MNPSFHLQNSTVLITGASSGLGAEFARQIAAFAKTIIIVARRGERLRLLAEEIRKNYPKISIHENVIDLRVSAQREELVQWIIEQKIPLNCLINDAACGDFGEFATADWSRLHDSLLVNIEALTHLTRLLLPLLRQQAPSAILNVSSLVTRMPLPHGAVYAATKAFVSSFSEGLRIEEASHGVVVAHLLSGQFFGSTEFTKKAVRPGALLPWFIFPDTSYFVSAEKKVVQAALKELSKQNTLSEPHFLKRFLMPYFLRKFSA